MSVGWPKAIADYVAPLLHRPAHLQVAALCLRKRGKRREVLLIGTRRSGRWIVPRGWPMPDRSLAEAALREAWEEAGVTGKVDREPLGRFHYRKVGDGGLRCRVEVFRVRVKALANDFPEAGERKRRWVSTKRAAPMVHEHELRALLRDI